MGYKNIRILFDFGALNFQFKNKILNANYWWLLVLEIYNI